MPTSSSLGIKVRKYQKTDESRVKEIFSDGMIGHIVPAGTYSIAKTFVFPIVIVLSSISVAMALQYRASHLTYLKGTIAILFIGTVLVFLGWVKMNSVMHEYVQGSFQTDMENITNHYLKDEDTNFFVAVDEMNGQIAGCVALDHEMREPETATSKKIKESVPKRMRSGKWGELRRMSVARSFRGRGIATLLHSDLVAFAKAHHYRGIFLTTSSLQVPAIRLYKKLGYQHVSSMSIPMPLLRNVFSVEEYEYSL